ncbi:MAG TPA: signal recognition particle protein [Candidatus Saccharimonadales bacterium]|nr:signal recognition particle protein [Candidatus Saccharimonadales bacterium]
MFDALTDRLRSILKTVRGQGRLTEANMQAGLREIRLALLEADVNVKVARDFIERVRTKALGAEVLSSLSPDQQLVKVLLEELRALLGEGSQPLRYSGAPPNVILLVGLQGCGKTSTAAKLARKIRSEGRSPLLVPADVYRPAAIDQLRTLGGSINVPVLDAQTGEDPRDIARRAAVEARTSGFDPVIVDTAGRLHVDDQMMSEVRDIAAILDPREILYVADSMTGQDAVTSAAAFAGALSLTGVVLTKLDGDARGGAALSIKAVTGVPIKLAGTGEKVEDLEVFHPERMASRIVGMGDVVSLIEKVEASGDAEEDEEAARSLAEGRFTLEDLRKQIRRMKKMGPLSSVLELLPGAPPMGDMQVNEAALTQSTAILDSMTVRERLRPELINGSRRRRIAAGSGTSVQAVNKLMKQYGQMKKMMRLAARKPGKSPGRSGKFPFAFK